MIQYYVECDSNNQQTARIMVIGDLKKVDGESKRLFFVEIKAQTVLSANGTGETIQLDCATFLEQKEGGIIHTVVNGSRRLVGILEQYIEDGAIKQGTPLLITYNGKKKNKSNNFSSDNWSIRPLIIKI